jgi:hypothetical protein
VSEVGITDKKLILNSASMSLRKRKENGGKEKTREKKHKPRFIHFQGGYFKYCSAFDVEQITSRRNFLG